METYKKALKEYESENEDGKFRLIYTYFGLAIYFSQILEETFSQMLWSDRIFREKVKSSKELNEIIEVIENSKKTMGNFINEIKQSYSLEKKLIEDLENILKKRNYLVHKYFKNEIQKGYSDLGQREMLEYLGNFIDEAENIDNKLKKYYEVYKLKLGLTQEKLDNLANEMIRKEIEREKTTANTVYN